LCSCPNHKGSPFSKLLTTVMNHLLAEVDFVYAHLFQPLLAQRGIPSLEIPRVDRSHRAGGQSELPGHLANRFAFAANPTASDYDPK
jgi:hypothetical protein